LPMDARKLEFDMGVQLAEMVIHQQDIRRALGKPRSVDPQALRVLLDNGCNRVASMAVAGAHKRGRGLSLSATDLEWRTSDGPEVSGPGEALLMALNGRADALADLTGDGVAILSDRIR
jgi:uncharacterized protein (TIGR03083 family)